MRRRKDVDGVLYILRCMRNERVEPSVVTSLLALRALREARQPQHVHEALDCIEAAGGRIGLRTWGIALTCLCEGCRAEDRAENATELERAAWTLLQRMLDRRGRHRLNAYVYNILMAMYASRGDIDEAVAVYGAMVAGARVSPDVVTFNTLLESLVRGHNTRHRRPASALWLACLPDAIVERMEQHGVRPNVRTLSAHLRLSRGRTEAVRAVEARAASHRIALDAPYYDQLIDAYACAGDVTAAAAVLKRLHASPSDTAAASVTAYAVNGVLKACAQSGAADHALQLVQNMAAEYRIEPDAISYTCALTALGRARRCEDAKRLYANARAHLKEALNAPVATAAILAVHDDIEWGLRVVRDLLHVTDRQQQQQQQQQQQTSSHPQVDFRAPAHALLRVCGRARAPSRALDVVIALRNRALVPIDRRCYAAFMKGVRESESPMTYEDDDDDDEEEEEEEEGAAASPTARRGKARTPRLSPLSAPMLYLLRLECIPPRVPRIRLRF
ncbi:hypothetical protein CDCA_CDCA19G4736 [Cyanidium caldarium]|uniref:Pentatricopeptide repeat-containing protein-mitochondrial domain-containing protein n=1 Tax=Cyanidium caldarium TaxID=2771 RepID=A0AAV9J2R1_CYACA|nr:hypothetical protein CDCA_CDCA19G4736 [Cyanidium caldarium]